MLNLKRLFTTFILLKISGLLCAQTSAPIQFSQQISAENLSEYVHVLASDSLEGRETGYRGLDKAANFLAAKYASFGIPPFKITESYFQKYRLEIMQPDGAEINVNSHKFRFLKDFYYLPGIQDTVLSSSNIVFLGYGIQSKYYNDYKSNIDLKNKVVLILSGEPIGKNGNSLVSLSKNLSEWSNNWKKKLTYLESFHPAAILIVANDIKKNIRNEKLKIESPTLKLSELSHDYVPYFYISTQVANHILSPYKTTIKKLKKKIQKDTTLINTFDFNSTVQIKIERKASKLLGTNVLGYIEGTDLKDEVVLITAHIDHLGKNKEATYYGADDNASGTAALLEMARVFAYAKSQRQGPRKSVLCIGFSGEEKGLLGSDFYVKNPVFPLVKTTVDLNIDMMGRRDEKHQNDSDYIYLIGSEKNSRKLFNLNEAINKQFTHLKLDYTFNLPNDPNRFFFRSDQYNFAKFNVPVLFYFNGIHKDYHKATDTPDKIDYQLLKKRTELVFITAWIIANNQENTYTKSNNK
jgi:hypothetical protein